MTVNLTRIYTKLGDGGETHLGDMSRVSKLHPRVEAYGTVDELNAHDRRRAARSRACRHASPQWLRARAERPARRRRRPVGARARRGDGEPARERLRVGPSTPSGSSSACDEVNATLEPLRSFVIPGGTPAAAQLHVCRTVCRRAERRAIAVGEDGNPEVVRYLNRLSDLLFILSRAANEAGAEPLWEPGAHGAGATAAAGVPAPPMTLADCDRPVAGETASVPYARAGGDGERHPQRRDEDSRRARRSAGARRESAGSSATAGGESGAPSTATSGRRRAGATSTAHSTSATAAVAWPLGHEASAIVDRADLVVGVREQRLEQLGGSGARPMTTTTASATRGRRRTSAIVTSAMPEQR